MWSRRKNSGGKKGGVCVGSAAPQIAVHLAASYLTSLSHFPQQQNERIELEFYSFIYYVLPISLNKGRQEIQSREREGLDSPPQLPVWDPRLLEKL